MFLDLIRSMHGPDLLRVKGIVKLAESPDQPVVIHGVQHVFHPPATLAAWPDADHRTRLVFIMSDTAGTSPRDPELARRLRLLNNLQASIETSLVLPASTQAGAIDEVVPESGRHHARSRAEDRGPQPLRHRPIILAATSSTRDWSSEP